MTSNHQGALNVDDARAYLGGVSRRTLYRLIESHDIDRIKVGSRTMITRNSLDAYVARLTESRRAGA